MINLTIVQQLFTYNAETGELCWRTSKNNVKAGDVAGSIKKNGYKYLRLGNKSYLVHRIVYLHHLGFLPKIVDHIDGNPLNNRIENLRGATQAQNMRNVRVHVDNPLGLKGVSWDAGSNKYRAQIYINKKQKYLGVFTCPVDAAQAYNLAAETWFNQFANYNGPINSKAWEIFNDD